MLTVVYNNLDKSDAFNQTVINKVKVIKEKFPQLNYNKIRVVVNMDNSPVKPGKQLFSIKFFLSNGRFKDITIKKSASCLYTALSIASETLTQKIKKTHSKFKNKRRDSYKLKKLLTDASFIDSVEISA